MMRSIISRPSLGCAYDTHNFYSTIFDVFIDPSTGDEYCLLRRSRTGVIRRVVSAKIRVHRGNYTTVIMKRFNKTYLQFPRSNLVQLRDITGAASESLWHLRNQMVLFFAVNSPRSFVDFTFAFLYCTNSIAVDVRFLQYCPKRDGDVDDYCDLCGNTVCQ